MIDATGLLPMIGKAYLSISASQALLGFDVTVGATLSRCTVRAACSKVIRDHLGGIPNLLRVMARAGEPRPVDGDLSCFS